MRMSTAKRFLYNIDSKYKAYTFNIYKARYVSLFVCAAAHYVCCCLRTMPNAIPVHCEVEV
jgi:hypothetical protein